MRNFRDAYRHAVDELPIYHMDAGEVRDELHHRRMVAARRRKAFLSAAAAACVFLICGVGTATAMNYYSSTIKVRDNGFSFQGKGAIVLPEEGRSLYGETEDGTAAGDEPAVIMEDGNRMPADPGTGTGNEVSAGIAAQDGGDTVTDPQIEIQAIVEDEKKYSTIEEFRTAENITIAIPDLSWLGDPGKIEFQEVRVVGEPPRVMVNIRTAESYFYMSQSDNRENQSYASSKVFTGDVVNERMFTNNQGLTYTVFDTEEDGEITATHAAVSINGRDLTLDFHGYDEETVNEVLNQLDLSIYITES